MFFKLHPAKEYADFGLSTLLMISVIKKKIYSLWANLELHLNLK